MPVESNQPKVLMSSGTVLPTSLVGTLKATHYGSLKGTVMETLKGTVMETPKLVGRWLPPRSF